MENVEAKIRLADLKQIEKDLHRELTDDEAALLYAKGWEALFAYMGMSKDKYVAYRRLLELVITYCTKDRMEFERLRNSKDFSGAYELLAEFIIASYNDNVEKGGFALDEDQEDEEVEDDLTASDYLKIIVDAIPESEHFWLEEYFTLDPDAEHLYKFVKDLYDDEEGHCVEDTIGDALDVVKDYVVEQTAYRLAKSGEAEKLPEVLLTEVCDYIDKNWTNYSMQLINGVLKVKKF